MSWLSSISHYWVACEGLARFKDVPPRRNIVDRSELLIWACEDGADEWLSFAKENLNLGEWDPISPAALARHDGYDPPLALAGACLALLAGHSRALPYLNRLADTLGRSNRLEVSVTGRAARAVCDLQWQGSRPWTDYPETETQFLSRVTSSRLTHAINVAHCPHALYELTRSFLVALLIVRANVHGLDEVLRSSNQVLGPHREGRQLVYRRSTRPPRRKDVFAGTAPHGCDAIEVCGDVTRVYYDLFSSYASSPLPIPLDLEDEPELLDAILGRPAETLAMARAQVPSATWRNITSTLVHVVAIDPAITIVNDELVLDAEQRLGARLEIVPFLEA